MEFTTEAIEKRYAELAAKRAPLVEKRDVLWSELSALVAGDTDLSVKKAAERQRKVREDIKKVQASLAPIDAEYANCARALGAKRIAAG